MTYSERGNTLDLSSTGRGLQQTLLILAYMYANPGAVLLLDEPDAHLEILRQHQIYRLITDVAVKSDSQIIAASHSEIILNDAAGRDMVIAFVGDPHRLDNRGSQVMKALRDIGFDQYYQAEQTGWVLYLEGSTDLAILQAFARRMNHEEAMLALERPFVRYVGNDRMSAVSHYWGIKEALPNLKQAALFDRLEYSPPSSEQMEFLTWRRREIENYICTKDTLEQFARKTAEADFALEPLFIEGEVEKRLEAMHNAIGKVQGAMETLGLGSPWSVDTKVSDDFLPGLFREYFAFLEMPNLMNKKDFYELVEYVPDYEIDPEIREKLDQIASAAAEARSLVQPE